MYNVGLGDSFLVRFPAPRGRTRRPKMLVDCGEHTAGPSPVGMAAVVAQILEDAAADEPDGVPRVDLVVCTHRHRDHVSGFTRDGWQRLEAKEVWLPWTEHPTDAAARYIRALQATTVQGLVQQLKRQRPPRRSAVALALNSLTNTEAMDTLAHGFAGQPARRYLPEPGPAGETAEQRRKRLTFPVDVLPGVTVSVLGPSRDPNVIRDMNPPEGEAFLRAAGGAGPDGLPSDEALAALAHTLEAELRALQAAADAEGTSDGRGGSGGLGEPPQDGPTPLFRERWQITPAAFGAERDFRHLWLVERDRETIQHVDDASALAATVQLEDAVNGTSLMLAFQVGNAMLLFPGDAQWGTWQAALKEWTPLLKRTTFLKVGHHGSHNASPKAFVEDVLGATFSAMVSTRPTAVFPEIPRKPLIGTLRQKSPRVLLSSDLAAQDDAAHPLPAGFRHNGALYAETTVPV